MHSPHVQPDQRGPSGYKMPCGFEQTLTHAVRIARHSRLPAVTLLVEPLLVPLGAVQPAHRAALLLLLLLIVRWLLVAAGIRWIGLAVNRRRRAARVTRILRAIEAAAPLCSRRSRHPVAGRPVTPGGSPRDGDAADTGKVISAEFVEANPILDQRNVTAKLGRRAAGVAAGEEDPGSRRETVGLSNVLQDAQRSRTPR